MQVTTVFGNPLAKISGAVPRREHRFRILVLGDFGGPVGWSEPVPVDRDNFDGVMHSLGVRTGFPVPGSAQNVELSPHSVAGFHPDHLFESLPLFEPVRIRRARLTDPSTYADEAAALPDSAQRDANPGRGGQSVQSGTDGSAGDSDLLSQMLETAEQGRENMARLFPERTPAIHELIRKTAAPFVVDKVDVRQAESVDALDQSIAEAMRTILHAPEFQQLEAAWLGIKMLVRRLETGPDLQIGLANVTRRQLEDDLASRENLTESRLFQMLKSACQDPEGDPWTVVVGNYWFGSSPEDARLLGRIGRIHDSVGALFVAGGSPVIAGCRDFAATPDPADWNPENAGQADHWLQLRADPGSASVVLALPRILGRLPYGPSSDPIESFAFQEISDHGAHGQYLWMNPAFGIATVLGRHFSENGRDGGGAWPAELDGLPLPVHRQDGDVTIQPCAEIELFERGEDKLASLGLTVIRSVRDQATVHIPSLRSLSQTEGEPVLFRRESGRA